ncbi:MAG: hypothetical protein R3D55_01325 [Chloroflexota bacterium]
MWLRKKFILTVFLLLIPVLFVTGTSFFSLWPISEASAVMPAMALEENIDVNAVDASHVLFASPSTRPMLDLTTTAATAVLPVEQSSSVSIEHELLGNPEDAFQGSG